MLVVAILVGAALPMREGPQTEHAWASARPEVTTSEMGFSSQTSHLRETEGGGAWGRRLCDDNRPSPSKNLARQRP